MRARLALAVAAIPSLALANPLTFGVGAGVQQSKEADGYDPNHTLGVFGRLAVTRRVGGQLELAKIEPQGATTDIKEATGLLVVDLGDHGRLMPMIIAGVGLARAVDQFQAVTTAHHIEGGFALEYRADGGLVVGADARMGGRSIDSQSGVVPLTCCIDYYQPETLHAGEYRSARLYAAIRF